jgi:hypothetical protein
MTVAPQILSGVPGSFARGVFHERHPKLVDQVIAALPYEPAQQVAIHRLLDESINGVLNPLAEDTPDRQQWHDWGADLWGRPWGEAPFLWAESYFYRRLLEATGYFRPGPWQGIDPFAPTKSAELNSSAVSDELNAVAGLATVSDDKQRDVLLLSSLWGNQADLSFQLTATSSARSDNLVTDDSAALWAALAGANNPTLCIVADNAGRELLPDLILIDHLLTTGVVSEITVHLKPSPYYVSDATMTDLLATIHRLQHAPQAEAGQIGQRLWRAMTSDQLEIRTHEFFTAPLSSHDMPADLAAEFGAATMTVLKGDLNYRRLLGDRHWEPTTPFADLVSYFPSPVTALRTLKSDVIAGLTTTQVEELDSTGRPWRTNGEHGLIQAAG